MNATFLIWLSLNGMFTNPSPPQGTPQFTPAPFDMERMHREQLQSTRRAITLMSEMIKWKGTEFPVPEQDARLAKYQNTLQRWKEEEAELTLWWLKRRLKPGLETDREALDRLTELQKRWDEVDRLNIAPPPRELPVKPRLRINFDRDYQGKVISVGKDSFVFGPGWEMSKYPKEVGPDDTSKPRRVLVPGALAGGDPTEYPEALTYHLADLKTGDLVRIVSGVTKTGEEYSLRIIILRRPGGKVPLLPEDRNAPLLGVELHLRSQAYQDWEEKGVPIPKRFLNREGRTPWTNPPYPPVAPQPREVKK